MYSFAQDCPSSSRVTFQTSVRLDGCHIRMKVVKQFQRNEIVIEFY